MKRFIVKIIGVSLAITLIGWLVFSLFIPEYYIPILPFLLAFFLLVNIVIHLFQLRQAKKDLAKFTRSNMLLTFFKLVLYSVFAFVYIANDTENALVFVICLMLLYIIFTFIEVTELSRITRGTKE
ncbi:MAG: hypothetical protein HN778_03705 [Prolixibacteraceae bacterium]|jgi:hypothetical protein|nr:hypothetical protein [Prolixibacteraceae bacterium]MBT6763157.1 hypothetical protein [Prolixibacteraceae bacterium]MBT6998969.1 hypothetical protein [Prolixibacteraceae bacterium]MBT7393918.1 hypothetical protein [Prolixibacteraceae bacterium]